MSKPLVSEDLWAAVAPLLPPEPEKPKGGRPRLPDRAALAGILFVLRTGHKWQELPVEMGCGSCSTCWRRLRDWQAAGVWERLHHALLQRLGRADRIDWARASLDSASVPAKGGAPAEQVGPNPTDRDRPGTKRHLVVDRRGVPLVSCLTPANRHDPTPFAVRVDAVPPIRRPAGQQGRPRKRPDKLHADKAYDFRFRRCRQALHARRIKVRIARRGVDSSAKLGRHRWVVENTQSQCQ